MEELAYMNKSEAKPDPRTLRVDRALPLIAFKEKLETLITQMGFSLFKSDEKEYLKSLLSSFLYKQEKYNLTQHFNTILIDDTVSNTL